MLMRIEVMLTTYNVKNGYLERLSLLHTTGLWNMEHDSLDFWFRKK
jgi:hypothetical protein